MSDGGYDYEAIIEAIDTLIAPRRKDREFMQRLRERIEQDKPVLDALRDSRDAVRIDRIPSHTSPPKEGEPVYVQIDRIPYQVKVGTYGGARIRRFAHPPISADYDLWLVHPLGENDEIVRDEETVKMDRSGIRFITTKRFINAG